MSDEQAQPTEAKRPPGRPKGAKKPVHRPLHRPLREPVHGHADAEPGSKPPYTYIPYEAADRFYIPRETTDEMARDWGIAVEWKALDITGMPNPFFGSYLRNLWEYIPAGDCDGKFDHLGVRDGIIKVDNMVLMRRPIEMQAQAIAHKEREAKAAITRMRQSHAEEGIPGVSMPDGGRHPSALQKNRHRSSYEAVDIPDR